LIKVILAVTNDIVTDNRVHKVAQTLGNYGYKVTVAGRRLPGSLPLFGRSYKTRRFKLWFNKTALFYANYNIRLFFYLLKVPVDIIVANDLDTLIACRAAAKIRRKALVFDSHELFTEVPELVNRPLIKYVWYFMERLLLPGVKWGYTVSAPIQEYYSNRYSKNFGLIRNVAMYQSEQEFKGFSGETVIIYQGSVNMGRGLELMLHAMQQLEGCKLWIIGQGGVIDTLKDLTHRLDIADRVIFFGKIPLDNLFRYTVQAHIGISLEEDLGLNYRFALPNKVFDYIQARVPLVVSDLPEMSALVKNYGIGMVLENREVNSLVFTIRQLIEDKNLHQKLNQNLELAARELCWQREEEKLIALYRKVYEQSQGQSVG
jgi:glycosyltransferase involved in cell wall biosynthesis